MPELVNWRMASHPINWLIVWVVVTMGAFAWREIHRGMGCDCGNSDSPD
jgi:hypothetical protein